MKENNKTNKYQKQYKINHQIKASFIRLLSDSGEQLGTMSLGEALKKAQEFDLDLVEINPNTNPPICKIIEYSKLKYEEEKKKKEQKKNQVKTSLKEIGIRPNTDVHDLEVKAKAIQRMLKENNKVKINVLMRGREILHQDQVVKVINNLLNYVGSYSVDTPLKIENKLAILIIAK